MAVIQKETVVATTATEDNVLSGSAFEFARGNVLVSIGVTASQAGGLVTIQSGSDVVLEESPAYVSSTFPVIPDQFFYSDVATMGDRLVVRVRNTAGSNTTFRTIVQVTNL